MASIPPPKVSISLPPTAPPRKKKVPWWVWLIVVSAVVCGGSGFLFTVWAVGDMIIPRTDASVRADFKRANLPTQILEIDPHTRDASNLQELQDFWAANGQVISDSPRYPAEVGIELMNTLRTVSERYDRIHLPAFMAVDPYNIQIKLISLQASLIRLMNRSEEHFNQGRRQEGERDFLAATEWMVWLSESHFPGTQVVFAEVLESQLGGWVAAPSRLPFTRAGLARVNALVQKFDQPLNWMKAVEAEPVVMLESMYAVYDDVDLHPLARNMAAAKIPRVQRIRESIKARPDDLLGLTEKLREVPPARIATGGMSGLLTEIMGDQTHNIVEAELRRQALMAVMWAGRAMEVERRRTGSFPRNLPARVLVDDPFRPGTPLQYRFDAPDEAYVWSVGSDRQDNGGKSFWDLRRTNRDRDRSLFAREPDPGDYVY
jgi:hypothetical protein